MRALLLLLLVAPGTVLSVDAQQVYRCRSADGSTLFTDRACHHHGAVAIAVPQPIASVAELPWNAGRQRPLAGDDLPAAALGCPAEDPDALRDRLQQAIAARDLNALAGLYHWNDAGAAQARQVLGRLRALIDADPPELRIEASGRQPGDADDAYTGLRLVLYPQQSGRWPPAIFALVADVGCVWLSG